jgi:hypothetical protein
MVLIKKKLEFLNKVTHIQVPGSREFLDVLHNYQLLKKDSATLRYLFSARVVFDWWLNITVILYKNRTKSWCFLVSAIYPSRTKNWNYFSNQCSLISERTLLFEGLPASSCARQVRAICRWRVWSTDGMTPTGKNWSTKMRACCSCTYKYHKDWPGTEPGHRWWWASKSFRDDRREGGRERATGSNCQPPKGRGRENDFQLFPSNTQFVPRSKHTPPRL